VDFVSRCITIEVIVTRDGDSSDDRPRKERVIHTRVPAVLEQELKRLADGLRVPVSNVVRTILEDAVDALDSVGGRAEGELRDVRDRLRQRRQRLRPDGDEMKRAPLEGVVGFQPLLLARDESCTLCGRRIRAGDRGYLGIRDDGGGPRLLLDRGCLPRSTTEHLSVPIR
jgi:hypothetical protein